MTRSARVTIDAAVVSPAKAIAVAASVDARRRPGFDDPDPDGLPF